MSGPKYLLVLSGEDPVASALAESWPIGPALDVHVGGVPIRRWGDSVAVLRRAGRHIFDASLERELPSNPPWDRIPVVFPSIHRSRSETPCLTVHPIGNPGASAEFGGIPRQLVPPAPQLMRAALSDLRERARPLGVPVSYEATHHGPFLSRPSCFVEVFASERGQPDPRLMDLLQRTLGELKPDLRDQLAVGIGGGHYAPHFTDLAVSRRWAFGHILSRHALAGLEAEQVRTAVSQSGAAGLLFARAGDATLPVFEGFPRLRETDAPARNDQASRATGGPASGT
ncbi:MAG TPA: D-aminoacyl-tRNA deacylase [Thermoplasmata archaeon]|nr:D-aminoacyl-tRNA deacylase [Thermoplasmata archaeon]